MNTAQDQQSRAPYEDGKWYWVEREGWHGEPPTIAPAFYKANCDSWYSHVFSGISTPYLKVLEPCELQAARALPAPSSASNVGGEPAEQWKCGNEFLPYHPSASHVEPAYRDGWNACFKAAAQVQAMGRVPPAVKKSYAHDSRPHAEYPWFCADCGYALHDELMHPAAQRPPAAHGITNTTGD